MKHHKFKEDKEVSITLESSPKIDLAAVENAVASADTAAPVKGEVPPLEPTNNNNQASIVKNNDITSNTTVESSDNAQSPSLLLILSQNKQLPFLLGLILALVIGTVLYSEGKQNEDLFQKHKAAAELLDYGQKPEQGGLVWHQAIDDAKKLNNKQKLIADMYVKASIDERISASRTGDRSRGKDKKLSDAEIDRIRKSLHKQQELDLKAALKIYKQIPNTKAEQLIALQNLAMILGENVNENDRSRGPAFSLDGEAVAAKILERGFSELESSLPGLGFSTFHKYLDLTRTSRQMRGTLFQIAGKTKPGDTQRIAQLIPIMLDVTYYSNDSLDDLQFEHTWLDWAVSQTVAPKTFEDKVNFADNAKSTNGAIVEYLKCLGEKDDANVRTKLITALKLARKADFTTDNPTGEYIDCLEKIRKLDLEAFGENAERTRLSTQALGIAYGADNNFEAAEACLKSIKPNLKLDTSPQLNVAYNLADVYAREGKFDLALAEYSRGQKYEKELQKTIFGSLKDDEDVMRFQQEYGIWARIARVYIAAGRYKESIPFVQKAKAEVAPDCFGSSGGPSGGSTLME